MDEPSPQAWKRRRLVELGLPEWLHFVPVDFEVDTVSIDKLAAFGFDPSRPAVVASTGVTMYLTKKATIATLRVFAGLAPGSTFAVTFLLPIHLFDEVDRPALAATEPAARQSGTPVLSFYSPAEMMAMALGTGSANAHHVAGTSLAARYFADRNDGLRPLSGEDFLLATT